MKEDPELDKKYNTIFGMLMRWWYSRTPVLSILPNTHRFFEPSPDLE